MMPSSNRLGTVIFILFFADTCNVDESARYVTSTPPLFNAGQKSSSSIGRRRSSSTSSSPTKTSPGKPSRSKSRSSSTSSVGSSKEAESPVRMNSGSLLKRYNSTGNSASVEAPAHDDSVFSEAALAGATAAAAAKKQQAKKKKGSAKMKRTKSENDRISTAIAKSQTHKAKGTDTSARPKSNSSGGYQIPPYKKKGVGQKFTSNPKGIPSLTDLTPVKQLKGRNMDVVERHKPVRPRTSSTSGEKKKAVGHPGPSPNTLRRNQEALAKAQRIKAQREANDFTVSSNSKDAGWKDLDSLGPTRPKKKSSVKKKASKPAAAAARSSSTSRRTVPNNALLSKAGNDAYSAETLSAAVDAAIRGDSSALNSLTANANAADRLPHKTSPAADSDRWAKLEAKAAAISAAMRGNGAASSSSTSTHPADAPKMQQEGAAATAAPPPPQPTDPASKHANAPPAADGASLGYGHEAGGYEYVSRQIQTLNDGSKVFGPLDFSDAEGQMGSFCAIFASPIAEPVLVNAVSGQFFFRPNGAKEEHTFWAGVFRVGGTGDDPKAMLVDRSPFRVNASAGPSLQRCVLDPPLQVQKGEYLGYVNESGYIDAQVRYASSPETALYASPCAPGLNAVSTMVAGEVLNLKMFACSLFLRYELQTVGGRRGSASSSSMKTVGASPRTQRRATEEQKKEKEFKVSAKSGGIPSLEDLPSVSTLRSKRPPRAPAAKKKTTGSGAKASASASAHASIPDAAPQEVAQYNPNAAPQRSSIKRDPSKPRPGIEELMRKMKGESESVIGQQAVVPARDPKAVTATQPSPRSRRKLPPSPMPSPSMGRKLPPSPSVGRKLPQPNPAAVAAADNATPEAPAPGAQEAEIPGKDLSSAHLASSVAMLQRIQNESKTMRDELQRMQDAAKAARLVVQNSGPGSARQSPPVDGANSAASAQAPTTAAESARNPAVSSSEHARQRNPVNQDRTLSKADTALINEIKRSSGDFTDVLKGMENGVSIPESILPEAIAPEAIATDDATGGAWFNARLGSGGGAAQVEIREAGEPELVAATVVAAAPAAVVASVAAPALATPGAEPPKELNLGTMGSDSPKSTPKRKSSIREKMSFWKRGNSEKKKDKKGKGKGKGSDRKSMISSPVGVNGDLSGLTPEMAAAAKMMWEADEQLRAIRAGETPRPYPGPTGSAAPAPAKNPEDAQMSLAKQLMQEKEDKAQQQQTEQQRYLEQQALAAQLVKDQQLRRQQEQELQQQKADAEADLQKRLQRERENREKMAAAAAAAKAAREEREWQENQARLQAEAEMELAASKQSPEFDQEQAVREAEERFRQHEEWRQMQQQTEQSEAGARRSDGAGGSDGDGSPPPPPPPSSAPPPLDGEEAAAAGDLFDEDDAPVLHTDLDSTLPPMSASMLEEDASAASSAYSSANSSPHTSDGGQRLIDSIADVHPYDSQFTVTEDAAEKGGEGAEARDEDGDDWI